MLSLRKLCATFAATCTLFAGATTAAIAAPVIDSEQGASPQIIGGSQASIPWVVQLKFNVAGVDGTSGCTGEQISPRWVLTAKHCVDGAYNMRVYHSNDQLNPGTATRASNLYAAPRGDIALVQLDSPVDLGSYPQLDFDYIPTPGEQGLVAGYGLGAWDQPTSTLRAATVQIKGYSRDAYGGNAVALTGVNGASNRGDSGGPLLVGDHIVAVCSTGDRYPGGNIHSRSNYALLGQSADWIRNLTGVSYSGTGAVVN